jgi:hypothetical protein
MKTATCCLFSIIFVATGAAQTVVDLRVVPKEGQQLTRVPGFNSGNVAGQPVQSSAGSLPLNVEKVECDDDALRVYVRNTGKYRYLFPVSKDASSLDDGKTSMRRIFNVELRSGSEVTNIGYAFSSVSRNRRAHTTVAIEPKEIAILLLPPLAQKTSLDERQELQLTEWAIQDKSFTISRIKKSAGYSWQGCGQNP